MVHFATQAFTGSKCASEFFVPAWPKKLRGYNLPLVILGEPTSTEYVVKVLVNGRECEVCLGQFVGGQLAKYVIRARSARNICK